MAATVTAGPTPNQITLEVTNPGRDDFGGMKVWISTVNGFVPDLNDPDYDGLDLSVVFTDLPAGVPHYIKYGLYSDIDPTDLTLSDLSAQLTATPSAPTVKAEDIVAGNIRGSNVFSASFSTRGSVLAAAALAAAATLSLKDTTDFASSGSAVIYSATTASDFDVVTYTGKTATSLTGVSGALAHASGEVIIPLNSGNRAITIDHNVNELRVYGPPAFNSSGTPMLLASLGVGPTGSISDAILKLRGSYLSIDASGGAMSGAVATFTHTAGGDGTVGVQASAQTALYGIGATFGPDAFVTGYGVYGTGGVAVYGGGTYVGVWGKTTNSTNAMAAVFGENTYAGAHAGEFRSSGGATAPVMYLSVLDRLSGGGGTMQGRAPYFRFEYLPTGAHTSGTYSVGDTTMWTGGVWATWDGAAWRKYLRENDIVYADSVVSVRSASGNTTRIGVDNAITIDNTTALTANRAWYGAFNDLISNLSATNHAGFSSTGYGALNRALLDGSGNGYFATMYGAYNLAESRTTANSTHDTLVGAYNHAFLSGSSGASDIYGAFNYSRADVAEAIGTATGSHNRVIVSNGATVTTGTLVSGSFSITGGATVTNRWGVNLTGQAQNHLDGYLEVDAVRFPSVFVNDANVNSLDDYEEGDWTPTIRGATTAGTPTYTTQNGRYRKVGNRVTGHGVVTWTALAGAAGDMIMSGLPYTAASGANGIHAPAILIMQNVTLTAGNYGVGWVTAGTANVDLRQLASAGTLSTVPLDTSGTIRIFFDYETA